MPTQIDSRHAGLAAASKRLKKSTAVTSNATTGVYTVAAGYLNDLAPNDVVVFSGLTGGSGIVPGTQYYLAQPRWAAGATTFSISSTPNGPILTGGSNISAGTVSSGTLTQAEDGVLSSNYVSPDSPAGR
jgi:hypothetical protein